MHGLLSSTRDTKPQLLALAESRDHDVHLYTQSGQQRTVVANSGTKLSYAMPPGVVIVSDK
jgi:hypothetical protein